jgi:hypothetical protein
MEEAVRLGMDAYLYCVENNGTVARSSS